MRHHLSCIFLIAPALLMGGLAIGQTNTFPTTGNVGIGTTSPAYLLDVNGNARIQGGQVLTLGGYSGINSTCLSTHIFNGCGSAGYLTFGFSSTTGAGTGTPDPLTIKQSNLSVGVNTNNPQAKLHVVGTGITAGTTSFLLQNGSGAGTFSVADDGSAILGATNTHGLLSVYSSSDANLNLYSGGTNASAWGVYAYGGANGSNYSQMGNSSIGLYFDTRAGMPPLRIINGTNTSEAMSVFGNGHIGINVNRVDNGNLLQVNGNVWTTGLVLPTGAAAGKVLTSDASGNATWQTATGGSGSGWSLTGNTAVNPATTFLGTTDNTPVGFRTGNTERMRIDGTTGNVLIGKTSQTNTGYVLDVNGVARVNKVVVNTTGADFVFDSTYRLAPLPDVERYIADHHHLAGVEPAAEMQQHGVDLGENQTRMLQKIEELTLYLIEQRKEVEELKKQNRKLEELVREALGRK